MIKKLNSYFNIVLLAALFIVGLILGNSLKSKEATINILKHDIEVILNKNKLLESKNRTLELNNIKLTDSVEVLNTKSADLELSKKSIIKYYEDKIDSIDNYSVPELSEFFSKRYGE